MKRSRCAVLQVPRCLTLAAQCAGIAASLMLVCFSPLYAQAPVDFSFEGIAGGRAPWTSVAKLTVDSAGNGSYYVMPPDSRGSGPFVLVESFSLTSAEMDSLWASVQSNDFFALDTLYDTPDLADGSFCNLSVTGNGVSHQVISINSSVPSLDNLVKDINAATPDTLDLIYNALVDDLAPPFAAAAASFQVDRSYQPFAAQYGTTVSRSGCTIDVTIRLFLLGAKATSAESTAIKNSIESKWNGPNFKYNLWCPIKFHVVVNVNSGGKATDHFIAMEQANYRSNVFRRGPNQPGTTGRWESDAGNDNTAAHEAGHLMGLIDRYNDDPKTGFSVAKPGHENDLMASLHKGTMPALPTQSDVNSIIAAAGVTCPDLCCIFDPIPFPPYFCSAGGVCEASATMHNLEESGNLEILDAFTTNPVFSIQPTNALIPPQGSAKFQVDFTPESAGFHEGYVVMVYRTPTNPDVQQDSVYVSGTASPPVSASTPLGMALLMGGLLAFVIYWQRRRLPMT